MYLIIGSNNGGFRVEFITTLTVGQCSQLVEKWNKEGWFCIIYSITGVKVLQVWSDYADEKRKHVPVDIEQIGTLLDEKNL